MNRALAIIVAFTLVGAAPAAEAGRFGKAKVDKRAQKQARTQQRDARGRFIKGTKPATKRAGALVARIFKRGPKKPLTYTPSPGEHVDHTIKTTLAKANKTGRTVQVEFNGARFTVKPGANPKTLMTTWKRSMSYASKRNKARRQKMEQRRAAQIARFAAKTPLIETPPKGMKFEADGLKPKEWNPNKGDMMMLTPEQVRALPKGTVVYTVLGDKVGYAGKRIVGLDKLDTKTRLISSQRFKNQERFTQYGFVVKPSPSN